MSQSLEEMEREEIEMLLPWYVTGRLDPGDAAKVEAYVAAHPDVARQLDLVRSEREETVAANEALGTPSVGATARVMAAALTAATPLESAWRALQRSLQPIGDLFVAPSAHAVRWAAAAVAAVVAIETVALATLVGERASSSYQVASGGQTGDGVAVLLVFADEARAPAISKLLADFDASIVDGPRAGGVYKIRLRTEDRSQAARDALIQRLAGRRDVVRAVLPSRD
jgi:anti-sigma factor RsiW